jgi:glucose-6-phosphate 1-epimerase
MSDDATLNRFFELAECAELVQGSGRLPKLRIKTKTATAEIYLYGAQVTSWKPEGADEVLFVSEKSHWEEGRAIRGGIPVCFPWFRGKADDPHAPSHGFVRTRTWHLEGLSEGPEDSVTVSLSTESDDSTRRWWPFEFRLEYRITVGRALKLELEMRNTGQSELRFEEALHAYFKVGDVQQAEVRGLDGLAYLDNRDGNRKKVQLGDLRLTGQTDNAYLDPKGGAVVFDPVGRRMLRTQKQDSSSTIVWNPWRDGAASLADLGEEEWREMLCVEGGNILESAIVLKPGQAHSMIVSISVEREPNR